MSNTILISNFPRTTHQARVLSVSSTFLCILFMIPPVILGVVAKSVWVLRTYLTPPVKFSVSYLDHHFSRSVPDLPLVANDTSIVLPAVIFKEAPKWVSMISLAAIR